MNAATISACGRYRYDLVRRVHGNAGDAGMLLWVMLNPSTADAAVDDPTIRRVVGFSRRLGFGGVVVVNLFAWRAAHPAALLRVDDPVGPDNDVRISKWVGTGLPMVMACGVVPATLRYRVHDVLRLIEQVRCDSGHADAATLALGVTATGWPRHPLYLRGDARLQQYTASGLPAQPAEAGFPDRSGTSAAHPA